MLAFTIVAMLHNTKENRYHPIWFRDAPFPGGADPAAGSGGRYKSGGHHTEGFTLREEALESAKELAGNLSTATLALDEDIPWDGEDIPAMSLLFLVEGDKARVAI